MPGRQQPDNHQHPARLAKVQFNNTCSFIKIVEGGGQTGELDKELVMVGEREKEREEEEESFRVLNSTT